MEISPDGHGELRYLAVCHILGPNKLNPWVVGYLLREEHGVCQTTTHLTSLKLCENVRRAGLIHVCNEHCKFSSRDNVVHSESILAGGRYFLLKRSDGFPPHLT